MRLRFLLTAAGRSRSQGAHALVLQGLMITLGVKEGVKGGVLLRCRGRRHGAPAGWYLYTRHTQSPSWTVLCSLQVVLILKHEEDGTSVGVVLNRPYAASARSLFRAWPELRSLVNSGEHINPWGQEDLVSAHVRQIQQAHLGEDTHCKPKWVGACCSTMSQSQHCRRVRLCHVSEIILCGCNCRSDCAMPLFTNSRCTLPEVGTRCHTTPEDGRCCVPCFLPVIKVRGLEMAVFSAAGLCYSLPGEGLTIATAPPAGPGQLGWPGAAWGYSVALFS